MNIMYNFVQLAMYFALPFLLLLGIIGFVYSLVNKKKVLGIVSFLSFLLSAAILLPSFIPISEKGHEGMVKGDMKLFH